MPDKIVNRVASSKLVTIDLEDYFPEEERILFDIKKWLFAEQILKEKDFRSFVQDHNWKEYQDKYIALTCSSDAIIPSWAYLLITVALSPYAKQIIIGNLKDLDTAIFQRIISDLPVKNYKDKPIIIKGCTNKIIPETAYSQLINKLHPYATSIMYGEACSSVPLYKKIKQ